MGPRVCEYVGAGGMSLAAQNLQLRVGGRASGPEEGVCWGEGRREGNALQPIGPQAAASLPPPAPTSLALADSPHKLHHELGEGKDS